MSLDEFKPGDKGRIEKIKEGPKEFKRRLMSLGLLPGTEFSVLRATPLGNPIEIRLRGSNISVRKEEIAMVEVQEL